MPEFYQEQRKTVGEWTPETIGYQLPVPDLMSAIATATGDILITNAQKSDAEPRLLTYDKGERPSETIYAASEKDYLLSLQSTLATFLEKAKSQDPSEVAFSRGTQSGIVDSTYGGIASQIKDFREHLIYINNVEFEHATDQIAERIIADAKGGSTIGLYDYKDRSPRYVLTKVLDKVKRKIESPSNYSPADAKVIKDHIVYDDNSHSLVSRVLAKPGQQPPKFYVVDDFALSRTNLKGSIDSNRGALTETGASELASAVSGLTICSRSTNDTHKIEPVFSSTHLTDNYSAIAVAGSWSSTDYGFEDILYDFSQKLGLRSPIDLDQRFTSSHRIKGRYDKGPDDQYLDPQYAEEYASVRNYFGPSN